MNNKSLSKLITELTRTEGLKQSIPVAQISEVIGLLGLRWRRMLSTTTTGLADVCGEFLAIIYRAGKLSAHRDYRPEHFNCPCVTSLPSKRRAKSTPRKVAVAKSRARSRKRKV